MRFSNLLKGRTTESAIRLLLESIGYRVTPLGVEKLLEEVKHLDAAEYASLDLPPYFRYLPDFAVSDPNMNEVFFIEVKFRKTFGYDVADELHDTLSEQLNFWDQTYTLLSVAEPAHDYVSEEFFEHRYMRVIHSDNIDVLKERDTDPGKLFWKLDQLKDLFPAFEEGEEEKRADAITKIFRELGNL